MSSPDSPTHPDLASRIAAGLAEIEQGLPLADVGFLARSRERVAEWVSALEADATAPETARRALFTALWTAAGHLDREAGRLSESVAAYDEALGRVKALDLTDELRNHREANLWTCRGLAQLAGETPGDWRAAMASFDEAIQRRSRQTEPDFDQCWGLAAAWMNRGEALEKLGGEDNLRAMANANETATTCLRDADLSRHPAIRTRLALAWMNRGRALAVLTERYGSGEGGLSLESYARAAEILRPGLEGGAVEPRRMLAVVLANLSRARLALNSAGTAEGEEEAREALSLIAEEEKSDPRVAELGLVLRVTLCRTLGTLPGANERHEEITDLAEEGLWNGGQAWERWQAPPSLPLVIGELFRCGAEAYQRHQPQFLAEYLLDHLDPERSRGRSVLSRLEPCHEAAVEILWRSIGQFQQGGFAGLGSEAFARHLDLFEEWQQCRQRLAEIRAAELNR